MRLSDWSSDVCSSDLVADAKAGHHGSRAHGPDRAQSLGSGPGIQLLRGTGDARQPDVVQVARHLRAQGYQSFRRGGRRDRKSDLLGKRVSVSVDLGCTSVIKKTNSTNQQDNTN